MKKLSTNGVYVATAEQMATTMACLVKSNVVKAQKQILSASGRTKENLAVGDCPDARMACKSFCQPFAVIHRRHGATNSYRLKRDTSHCNILLNEFPVFKPKLVP